MGERGRLREIQTWESLLVMVKGKIIIDDIIIIMICNNNNRMVMHENDGGIIIVYQDNNNIYSDSRISDLLPRMQQLITVLHGKGDLPIAAAIEEEAIL